MEQCLNALERKAIDTSGQLGSLYDASYDKLIKHYSIEPSNVQKLNRFSVCEVFPGSQSNNAIDYLEYIGFNDAIQQSILVGMLKTSGISSVINHYQIIHEKVRFLFYSYRSKKEKLNFTAGKADQIVPPPPFSTRATHMITEVLWGFEILCIIPIPDHQTSNAVDSLLENISNRLKKSGSDFILTDTENRQINQLINVTVYGSETCIENPSTPLLTVLAQIRDWQRHENFHHPLKYTMCSLRWLYNNDQFPGMYNLIDKIKCEFAKIRITIILIDKSIKDIEQLFQNIPENFSNPAVDQQWTLYKAQFGALLDVYKKFRGCLRRTLADIRRGSSELIEIDKILSDQRYSSLRVDCETFYQHVHRWLTKAMLIERLNYNQIQYIKPSDISSDACPFTTIEDIDAALKCSLIKEDSFVILWYSSDQLKRRKEDKWEQIFQQLILEQQQQTTQHVSLIYVDFSQYEQKLVDFNIVKLPKQSRSEHCRNDIKEQPLSSSSCPEFKRPSKRPSSTPSPPSQQPLPPATEINVLLLGETGVGKSTFINAFVNYLMFDTLQQAEKNEPIVLIPVSFLTTIGDQFQEFIVKFGDSDTNEDHEHQGQSVTQQCKSYVFNLNDRLRLRLIDTPGMGDTRGLAQDEKNINHILTYINNLSHLNAICLLFKPNASRLNIFFRSCVNQLLSYLTPIGYGNIMFCFTNARSTFYAPGDTGPLLRQMLKREHHDDIPFQKKNTFCFDSESFRYLAARKRGISFDEFQSEECIKSWTISVTESVRLLDYILMLDPCFLHEWQSLKKVALEISMLARPLMETLRLILYNWKLREAGLIEKEMVININPVTIEMCSNCAQSIMVPVESFYIIEYEPVKSKTAPHCMCPFDERQFLIESTIVHTLVLRRIDASIERFETYFYDFLFQCDRIIHFLQQKEVSNLDDPFKPVLERFLEEEQHITQHNNINQNMNKTIKEALQSINDNRHKNKEKLLRSNEKLSLKDVYEIIGYLKTILNINEQIECIKTSRRLKAEANERKVKIPSINNKTLAALINSY